MPGDFDLVKERVDIVQLVGERVQLRKAGRAYKGLCPFHSEKTPSFTVDPDRRTFKCFGCMEGGDVFDWLIKIDGVDKAEALKILAEKAGVELTGGRPPGEREREKRLLAAHETAHFYFRQALRGTPKGKAAAEYVAARGIDQKMVEQFGVAYAPDLPDGMLAYLRKKGYTDEEILSTGLVVETERGLLDRFRDRLIVPIRDARGRIIAFGGRAMRADQRGKYINSPQTALFNKSATLYTLDAAKAEARRQNEVVIVEGYFDAIASHQAGFTNVVASMGTALTEGQYRVLNDLHLERAVVAFDGDAAGQRSAETRGRELLKVVQRFRTGTGVISTRQGLGVYMTVLPPD
ncbi:MAG: DNA primase, partial [Chloroflexota bacterium]|nr:DNA primase [Chloroflexota bacterium]